MSPLDGGIYNMLNKYVTGQGKRAWPSVLSADDISRGFFIVTADLPTSPGPTTSSFADDTAVVTMDSDPAIAS
jgi:hypothetical protein